MAKLTYGMLVSVDGYARDRSGSFDWATPNEEVHRHANEEQARHGTAVYGRNMYEMMVYWETADQRPESTPVALEFARYWQATDKIVVSKTLKEATSRRTTLVSAFGPDDMRRLKVEADKDISVSGPTLASCFLNAGLVDEIGIYYVPVVAGGGLPMFRDVERLITLERIEEIPFEGGTVFMRYRVSN